MTRISDWPPLPDSTATRTVTAADEALLWDQGAEEALDQAVDIAGTRKEATEYALIGIGMALRANGARLEALTDELAGLADTLAAPHPVRRPVRRPWWQRLTSAFTGHRHGEAAAEACPDDPDGDLDGQADDAAAPAAAGGATVTPLRRKRARS
ncbi:hypothetical protein ACFY2Y_16580 [Janibacter hoylei]|uniref:hypothetical protein n=1 Tax=Janibacter hoylei TaxID=364298 RepID=UPI00367ED548